MKYLDHLLHPCLQCWRIETPSRAKEGLNVNSDLEFRRTCVLYDFKTFMCFCYLISEKFFNETQSQMLYKLTIFKRWLYLLLMCVLSLKKIYIHISRCPIQLYRNSELSYAGGVLYNLQLTRFLLSISFNTCCFGYLLSLLWWTVYFSVKCIRH